MTNDLSVLADDVLLESVRRIVGDDARATAELVAHLAEVDRRRLYLGLGHSSMFAYCTERLGLAEGSAYDRIEAARVSRRFPLVLELLAAGRIHLNTVRLLGLHLTDENHGALLEEACGGSRSLVEAIVARLHPRPAVPATLRRVPCVGFSLADVGPSANDVCIASLPAPLVAAAAPRPEPRAVIPLAPELFRLTVTMDAATRERWQALRERLGGDDAVVLAKAVEIALAELQRERRATTPRPTAAFTPYSRGGAPCGREARRRPVRVRVPRRAPVLRATLPATTCNPGATEARAPSRTCNSGAARTTGTSRRAASRFSRARRWS